MEQIVLSDQSIGFLKEIKKWTFFLSILGFIGAGFMFLAGVMMSVIFSVIDIFADLPDKPNFPFGLIGLLYVAIAVVYFFPAYYLYKFAKETGEALMVGDENRLASAFRFLKKHFKFIGIMAIVMIALYVLIIIVAIIVGVTSALSNGNGLFA